jgi:hypothetical protein
MREAMSTGTSPEAFLESNAQLLIEALFRLVNRPPFAVRNSSGVCFSGRA